MVFYLDGNQKTFGEQLYWSYVSNAASGGSPYIQTLDF